MAAAAIVRVSAGTAHNSLTSGVPKSWETKLPLALVLTTLFSSASFSKAALSLCWTYRLSPHPQCNSSWRWSSLSLLLALTCHAISHCTTPQEPCSASHTSRCTPLMGLCQALHLPRGEAGAIWSGSTISSLSRASATPFFSPPASSGTACFI